MAASVYLLRCADGTLYCGWTTDLERRLAAHNAGRASRYTRSRLPVELAWSQPQPDRGTAMREEVADQAALARGEARAGGPGGGARPLAFRAVLSESCRVLVAEKIADSGVDLLRERFEVDVGVGLDRRRARGADRRATTGS